MGGRERQREQESERARERNTREPEKARREPEKDEARKQGNIHSRMKGARVVECSAENESREIVVHGSSRVRKKKRGGGEANRKYVAGKR